MKSPEAHKIGGSVAGHAFEHGQGAALGVGVGANEILAKNLQKIIDIVGFQAVHFLNKPIVLLGFVQACVVVGHRRYDVAVGGILEARGHVGSVVGLANEVRI